MRFYFQALLSYKIGTTYECLNFVFTEHGIEIVRNTEPIVQHVPNVVQGNLYGWRKSPADGGLCV